ncbi:MAG: 50S ribosomal protein L18 [Desulfovibrionaceae bacterium]
MKMTKEQARARRKLRIRKKIFGTAERPRMVVFRSNTHLYVQIVDDATGTTLAATSSLAMAKGGEALKLNKESAEKVGKTIAKLAQDKNIKRVVFDRNGYIYHGRVKALADGAREGGLEF